MAVFQGKEEIEKHHSTSNSNKKSVFFENLPVAVDIEIPAKYYDILKMNFPLISLVRTGDFGGIIIKINN